MGKPPFPFPRGQTGQNGRQKFTRKGTMIFSGGGGALMEFVLIKIDDMNVVYYKNFAGNKYEFKFNVYKYL